MSKGDQPRGRSAAKASVISVRDSGTSADLAGGAGVADEQAKALCWAFKLTEPSRAVKNVTIGTEIYGSLDKSRVLVSSGIGALGFAPDAVARKIIQAKKSRDGDLTGQIISVNLSKMEAEVKLCLV